MATLNSSNITDGNTIEPTDLLQLYDALTPGGGTTGTYNVTVSGSLIGNASTATTASYALNGGVSTQINNQGYNNAGGALTEANFKFYAGTVKITGGTGATVNLTGLASKTLGTNVWVTATLQGAISTHNTASIYVRALSAGGSISFETVNAPTDSFAHYHVIYIPS